MNVRRKIPANVMSRMARKNDASVMVNATKTAIANVTMIVIVMIHEERLAEPIKRSRDHLLLLFAFGFGLIDYKSVRAIRNPTLINCLSGSYPNRKAKRHTVSTQYQLPLFRTFRSPWAGPMGLVLGSSE